MTAYRTADGLPGIALDEWRSGTCPGVEMTERDLAWPIASARGHEHARLDVQAGEEGVAVTSTGAVGLVRFTNFEVRIDPKLPGDHLQLFRMLEFAQGLDGLVQLAGSPAMADADANLLDFVVDILASATERILATGLRADYVEREDDLPALGVASCPIASTSNGSASTTESSAATTSTSTISRTTSCSPWRSHRAHGSPPSRGCAAARVASRPFSKTCVSPARSTLRSGRTPSCIAATTSTTARPMRSAGWCSRSTGPTKH